jgi:putative ABC transport system ATP-binding protein
MASKNSPLLKMEGVTKVYDGEVPFLALKGIDLEIGRGENLSIIGPSGSGKSTLLHLLGCLDKPTEGKYLVDGRDVRDMSDDELAEARQKMIGFVFQAFNLAPTLSVFQNVELPLVIAGVDKKERKRIVDSSLEAVGLTDKANNLPSQLSGGQKQRVAVARSLVNEPPILLADEPTGNLDTKTGQEVIKFILDVCKKRGVTAIFVTHDSKIADHTGRVVNIIDGKIEYDRVKKGG